MLKKEIARLGLTGAQIWPLREKDGVLVIVEVKYRSGTRFGSPLEAVTPQKQRRICRAAMGYFAACGFGAEQACRFDVIGITGDGVIRHIENAFPFQL